MIEAKPGSIKIKNARLIFSRRPGQPIDNFQTGSPRSMCRSRPARAALIDELFAAIRCGPCVCVRLLCLQLRLASASGTRLLRCPELLWGPGCRLSVGLSPHEPLDAPNRPLPVARGPEHAPHPQIQARASSTPTRNKQFNKLKEIFHPGDVPPDMSRLRRSALSKISRVGRGLVASCVAGAAARAQRFMAAESSQKCPH